MSCIFTVGLMLGFFLAVTGGIWGLVQAFQEDAVWGLLYLFVPFASLVFYIKKWGRRNIKKAFFLQSIGAIVMVVSSGLGMIFGWGAVVNNPEFSLSDMESQPSVESTQTLPSSPVNKPKSDPFGAALDSGMDAAVLAQSADAGDDWKLVASKWQEAVGLLKTVPQKHPHYGKAQKKISEYQLNLAIAQQKAAGK